MSHYEQQAHRWSQHGRQQSWDPTQGTPRSVASPTSQPETPTAFSSQFEEVNRATENLAKSGKMLGMGPMMHSRRDSAPLMGGLARQYPDYDSRMSAVTPHSISEYDGVRSNSSHSSSSLQGYLAGQRFNRGQNEAEQMMQQKRRAAAQRERELRNYHQEQQYSRNVSGAKPDRSMSPNAMSEDERRELIARQHRALYGNDSNLYMSTDSSSRPTSQDARVLAAQSASGHGASPRNFDYGMQSPPSGEVVPTQAGTQSRSRENSTTSPGPKNNSFAMYGSQQMPNQQAGSSSPGNSPVPQDQSKQPSSATGVAPIGTRPMQGSASSKRNTPPQPSPLGYGPSNDRNQSGQNERSQSAASNPSNGNTEKPSNLGWSGNSGPWGSNKVQGSVWG